MPAISFSTPSEAAAGLPDGDGPLDLSALTGLRSGKNSYYRDLVRRNERLQRAVTALDGFATRSVPGDSSTVPVVLAALGAALEAVDGTWATLVPVRGAISSLPEAPLAVDGLGRSLDAREGRLRDDLEQLLDTDSDVGGDHGGRSRPAGVIVPLLADGAIVARLCVLGPTEVQPPDIAVLRILAGQLTSTLLALDQGARLRIASQRQVLESERSRIARELHDSVAQVVLSLGMDLELARGEAAARLGDDHDLTRRCARAKLQAGDALDQLRRSIFMLGRAYHDGVSSLPEVLNEVVLHHQSAIDARLRVEGEPTSVPVETIDTIAMLVGEALFNVVRHSGADTARVRLRYAAQRIDLVIEDNGQGSARELRSGLERTRSLPGDGRHRGLVNMETRARDLGGSLRFRQSRLGGVSIVISVPTTEAP